MATYIVRKNHVISMVRGDYINFEVEIPEELANLENNIYYFILMYPNKTLEEAILIKEYEELNSDNSLSIELWPEDTELLVEGTYYYSIKVDSKETSESPTKTFTVIPNTKFFIVN